VTDNKPQKTWIPGKDNALEDSISRMQQQLQQLGFHIEEHSWLNPLPHVWSVHICDRDCPLLFTNGKGSSRKSALASALGEFFERLATNYFWADYYLGDEISQHEFVHYANERWFPVQQNEQNGQCPEGLLVPELWDFYSAGHALRLKDLVDINAACHERGVCALPYKRQSDQQIIYFPVNIIGNLYVSNGMSAGNTPSEARVQALSEIFERHVKFSIIAKGISLPNVPDSVIKRFPTIQAGIKKLRQKGFAVQVKDASLGGRYPVVNVTLLNPDNQGCYASFGAHPRFEVALERALTELLQGRELNALADFPAPSLDLEEVASQENLETHFIDSSGLLSWQFFSDTPDYEFALCDFVGNTDEEFDWLCGLIHKTGREIYIADYDHLGIYACRILVPSMSEIYACEDLLWENNNRGIAIRKDVLAIVELDKGKAEKLLEYLQQQDIDDLQPVAALLGLPNQPGSIWEDFRVAELKILLAAKSGNRDLLLQSCEWLLAFGHIDPSRSRLYHCVLNLLELGDGIENYSQAIAQLYPAETLQQAKNIIAGKLQAFDFTNTIQQALIDAYRKLHPAKAAA